jgi:hypothetical protein
MGCPLKFDPTISWGAIISFANLLCIIFGGFFAYRRWRIDLWRKRADYTRSMIEMTQSDADIRETFYLIEYDDKWYSRDFHENKSKEPKMDKMLVFYSYICYLKEQKLFAKEDFAFFEYQLRRILENSQVQDYLYNLYHFSYQTKKKFSFKRWLGFKKELKNQFSFHYLFAYGKKLYFEADICKKDAHEISDKYHKYLNW